MSDHGLNTDHGLDTLSGEGSLNKHSRCEQLANMCYSGSNVADVTMGQQ